MFCSLTSVQEVHVLPGDALEPLQPQLDVPDRLTPGQTHLEHSPH